MSPRLLNQGLAQTKHFLRFLIVGGINTLFGYAAFALLLYLGLHYALASFISTCAGILFNFNTTGKIVFNNNNHKLIVKFFLVYALLYLINLLLLKLMIVFDINLYLGSAVIVLPMAFLAYFLNKKFVFNLPITPTKVSTIMIKFDPTRQLPNSFVIVSAFMLLLLCYHLIFSSYFPNFQGKLGHDFSFVLPSLLDGYFWFKNNSLLDVPWFTPSFCGGQPYFADVQGSYYSVAQFLTFFFNPLTSAYLTILLFASLGFWGMYLVLRQLFKTSEESAFLAASLFMFNGFFIHRMMVGHFGFHGFMLVPLVAFLLLSVVADKEKTMFPAIFKTLLTGVLIAYWMQSGLTSLMIPASLSVLAIVCLYKFGNWQGFLYRSLGAMLIALALSAAKLVAGFAFMANFDRSNYLLPGFSGLFIELKLLFITLFFPTADIENTAFANLINMQWTLTHHEWEFGVTFIPLLIILLSWGMWLWKHFIPSEAALEKQSAIKWVALTLLAMILILPIALNFYTPEWNAILKRTPIIKSSSTLTRWWLIYVPVVIVYAAISLEKLSFLTKYRTHFVVSSVIIIIMLNLIQDRMYYDIQDYDGSTVLEAYEKAAISDVPPEIHGIGVTDGHVKGNDMLTLGLSQLGCYNASFGYRLENLPFKTLHPGSIFEQTDGYLNLKNPACYVFPTENKCRPGDHFKITQKANAELFSHYKPFHFEIPLKQKIANLITQLALVFVVGFLGYGLIRYIRQCFLFFVTALNDKKSA